MPSLYGIQQLPYIFESKNTSGGKDMLVGWVDLSTRKVTLLSGEDFKAEIYLGGRGLATRIYWEEVTPEVKAFDPENLLIMVVGMAVGTGLKAATRMSIAGKSPLTYPKDGFCYGNLGGFFPSVFRKTGIDGLVIKGQAESPLYLFLHERKIHLMDASDIWGKNAYETIEILKKRHGPGTEVMTIGRGGENLVHFATIVASHESAATGGFGAVMGSKRLKAIVAKGTSRLPVSNKESLDVLNQYIKKIGKRIRLSIPPKIVATGRAHLVKVVGKGSCYGCDMECIRGLYMYGQNLKGYRKCQSMEYYLPWLYSKQEEPITTLAEAPLLANDYGLCTFELESIVDWLYECYKRGIFPESETGLPLEKIGTLEFLRQLIDILSERQDLGEILAQGILKASEGFTSKTKEAFDAVLVPISKHLFIPARDLEEARGHLVNVLLYQMEPRRHRPLVHQGFSLVAWQFHQMDPNLSPVTTEVYREICRKFWGSELAADDTTFEGKALAAFMIQNRIYAIDSMGLCSFCWPITYSLDTQDHLGDPDLEARALATLKGIPLEAAKEAFERCGRETADLQRRILLKEGWELPNSDFPPEFHFSQPLPPNPIGHKVLVPDENGQPSSPVGKTLDRYGYEKALKEYYALRGWDHTGRPR